MNFYECISRLNSVESQYEIALSAFDLYQKEKETSIYEMIEKRNVIFSEHLEKIKNEKAENNEKFDEIEFKKECYAIFGLHKGLLSYPKEQAEQLKNSIRQNSLIVSLSTFEIFLNDLVRHILSNIPTLLSSNRKIEIGRLVSLGSDKVIMQEVERQVYALDRKSIFDRADYFQSHLKLSWGKDSDCINIISRINEIRNDIVHKDTDLKVNEADFKEAVKICKSVVLNLMINFVKHYKDISAPLISQKKESKT
jgi:hypothetical protein